MGINKSFHQSVPLVTIGITCFNAEESIERAIHSAIDQDWPNLEIIVIDDYSTDKCPTIIHLLAKNNSNIKFYRNDSNLGCAAARNKIIELANGEFISFFDDDDVSAANRVSLQVSSILEFEKVNPDAFSACYASGLRIYPNGYRPPFQAVGSQDKVPTGHIMSDCLLFNKRDEGVFYGNGTPTCSLTIRKSTLLNAGQFDVSLKRQEDVDLAIRLGFQGCAFIGVPEQVIEQYVSIGSDKSALTEFESGQAILDKYKDYLLSQNQYYYMKLWSLMRYHHFSGRRSKAVLVLLKLMVRYPVRALKHFSKSAYARFLHELKMKA